MVQMKKSLKKVVENFLLNKAMSVKKVEKLLQNKILHLSNPAENLQVRVGNRKNINLLRKNIISK